MAVDYTPTLGNYTELKPFRYWCQKVLPLVYDDSLSYYELLCKVVDYLNKTMEDVEVLHGDVEDLHGAYVQLQEYVNDYFDNLDVQNEIDNKLDAMVLDGSLSALISPFIPDEVAAWLAEHITPTTPAVDNTLSVSGAAADAKVAGDDIRALDADVADIFSSIVARNLSMPNVTGVTNTPPADVYKYDPTTWEQGSWSSTGNQDSPYWIRTGLINSGFLIHNKNTDYGYIAGRFLADGTFNGYPWMQSIVNNEWYYIPDLGSDYRIRLRVRHITLSTSPLLPADCPIEVFRITNFIPDLNNSLKYIDTNAVEAFGTSLDDVAGQGNYIFNIRASYWTDEPMSGVGINARFSGNYDIQIVISNTSNRFAFRLINRRDKTVALDWQYSENLIDLTDYLKYDPILYSDYNGTFANVAGQKNLIVNLAGSKWNDIIFPGCAINSQYTTNYDVQIIFALQQNRIAYRFVARATKEVYGDWHLIGGNSLNGKKVSIIGDSRSSYQGTVPSGNAYYYPKSSGAVLTNLNQMWWKRVIDWFGMTLVVNDSYSGAYVSNVDGENGVNILSSDAAIANLGSTAPDVILVFAGVNDWNGDNASIGTYDGSGTFPTSNDDFREAMAIMVAKVQNKFPNADIWLCTNPYCCPAGTGGTRSTMPVPVVVASGNTLKEFNDAIVDTAKLLGCGVIDLTKCGVNYANLISYTGDYETDNGLHYNANGHELIANVVINTLSSYYQNI